MPNIEIHGHNPNEAKTRYYQVRKMLGGAPYANEVVVTCVYSDVYSILDEAVRAPFFRVCVTAESAEDIPDIVERLGPLQIDIEVLMLHKFVPKKG